MFLTSKKILLFHNMYIAPADYTPFTRVVTFTAGSTIGGTQCTNVNIEDDNVLEPLENFFADLTIPAGSNAVIVTGRERATINILDDDRGREI